MFCYWADQSRFRRDDQASKPLWLHGTAFFVYALLAGDPLASMSDARTLAIVVTACALILHLLGVNHQLRSWDAQSFGRHFRWWFPAAATLGRSVGDLFNVPIELVMVVTGLLAGGLITNVMVEELPAGDKAKLAPFVGGVVLSISVTLLLRLFP